MEYHVDEVDQQVVLEEEIDENYEPTQKGTDTLHHAFTLSCDVDAQRQLLLQRYLTMPAGLVWILIQSR